MTVVTPRRRGNRDGICESIAEGIFEVQDDGLVLIHHDRAAESDGDRWSGQ